MVVDDRIRWGGGRQWRPKRQEGETSRAAVAVSIRDQETARPVLLTMSMTVKANSVR